MPLPPALINRRNLLQIGYSTALGASLAGWGAARGKAGERQDSRPAAITPRAKSVLFIFLFGGPSQLDTFDLKPQAPAEARGEFQPISTSIPGVQICEHLPLMAQRLQHWSLIRSMTCNPGFGDHRLAVHGLLGGIDELPAGAGLAASRRDWPSWCSVVELLRSGPPGLPASIALAGEVVDPGTGLYPGQNAGLLGPRYDPYQVRDNPADAKYRVDASLALPAGMSIDRLDSKRALLASLERQQGSLEAALQSNSYENYRSDAFRVLTSGRLSQALDLAAEAPAVRDRYGRHLFGQSLLMARRLIEAGIPIVQANVSYQALWDTHYNNFVGLRDLLPHLDRAVSNLTDDLAASGLLDETLVVMMGEFGRTPKLVVPDGKIPYFTSAGRDHWMSCFWGMFAGAGVRGGQVIGRSDAIAAFPVTRPYRHSDVAATVYTALGIDPATEIQDTQGRPLPLNHGRVIDALYTGIET
ncbi:MAG: DUF1501 domain-containing protein [Planctomycetes bacterium]|nr:DUF1501 domain-containing protein [Planctomycetota bacterium]